MNDLQTLISRRMADLGLSYRRAAAKSDGLVSHATLNSIVSGRHSWKLDERTVRGIALALDLDVEQVRKASGTESERHGVEFVLPPRAARLSAKDRLAVLTVVDALLTAAKAGAERRASDPDDALSVGVPVARRADDLR